MSKSDKLSITQLLMIISISLVFLIIVISVISSMIDLFTLKHMYNKNVNCFDRYGNKIEGVTCIEKVYCGILERTFNKDYCYEGELK